MKTILFYLIFSSHCFSQTLNIILDKIPKKEGKGMVALYNSEANYDEEKKPFKSIVCSKKQFIEKKCFFPKIPSATYSIAFYWDENNNEELDTNFIGYPSEPFGFSGNPTIIAGKPSFDSTKFKFEKRSKPIKIDLK